MNSIWKFKEHDMEIFTWSQISGSLVSRISVGVAWRNFSHKILFWQTLTHSVTVLGTSQELCQRGWGWGEPERVHGEEAGVLASIGLSIYVFFHLCWWRKVKSVIPHLLYLEQSFSTAHLTRFTTRCFSAVGCPVHCRMSSSTPGLHPLHASDPTPVRTTKLSPDLGKCPGGTSYPWWELLIGRELKGHFEEVSCGKWNPARE